MTDDPLNSNSMPDPLPEDSKSRGRAASRLPDPGKALEVMLLAIRRRGMGFWGMLLTLSLCAFFLADIAAMIAGNSLTKLFPTRSATGFHYSRDDTAAVRQKTIDDYSIIFSRNLFNSNGKIPGEDATDGVKDTGNVPVKTSLPFNLIGTLILRDELRSIATIEDRSATLVYPVRVDDEIPSKAKIIRIEARKVIFINTATGRREFVELPDDGLALTARMAGPVAGKLPTGAGIEKLSGTQYNISRAEIDKVFADFNNILTQARAVPNTKNGAPYGYKLFQIVPGSIYSKLGIVDGDAIVQADGAPINDPGKAFEMLNSLKTRDRLELQLERDGKLVNMTYDIR